MTKRRPKGSGSIDRMPDGRYRARFPYEPNTRTDIDGSPFPSYEAASRALDAILYRLRDLGATRGTPLRKVVDKLFVQRRSQGYASVNVEESDWKSYFGSHRLADRPVQSLTEGEVVDSILSMKGRTRRNLGQTLSLSTRKKLLNIVRAALHLAKSDGLISSNVLIETKLSDPKGKEKRKKRAKRALSWAQYEMLAKASHNAIEIDVAIWTGCRQGELRALHWPDVHNVEGSRCTCDEPRTDPHIVIHYGKPPTGSASLDDSTKSGEPRVVALFGRSLEVFRTMTRHTGTKKDGSPKNPKRIVFLSRLGGYRAKGRLVGRVQWAEWRQAAELQALRWHDLRHTFGTWAVRGVFGEPWSLEAVKEHMGHSELKTTERYADQRSGTVAAAAAASMRAISPTTSPANAEKLSHLRDLNSRPTVYEWECGPIDSARLAALLGFAGAVRTAAAQRDPFFGQRALDLADAVDDFVDAIRSRPMNTHDLDSRRPDHELRRAGR